MSGPTLGVECRTCGYSWETQGAQTGTRYTLTCPRCGAVGEYAAKALRHYPNKAITAYEDKAGA